VHYKERKREREEKTERNSDKLINLINNSNYKTKGWGENTIIEINKKKIFVKSIIITDLEYKNKYNTSNLYNLPLYYNYGIGSAGINCWRELMTHIKTTNYVLNEQCLNFPLLYHYRIIEEENKNLIEYDLEYWNSNKNIKEYIDSKNKSKYKCSFAILSIKLPEGGLHAGLVFYDFTRNMIERFDPYGDTVYYDKLVELFRKEKPECVKFENYVNSYIEKDFKKSSATKAKMLLLFLLTKLNCDDNLPNLKHDLEHVHSDNKKNSLMRPNNVYKLGNLTILEGKNSENGHKGNRSIKDRPYNEKRIQYEMSSNVITRDIAKKYENFTETVIIERTRELFKHLNELTDY